MHGLRNSLKHTVVDLEGAEPAPPLPPLGDGLTPDPYSSFKGPTFKGKGWPSQPRIRAPQSANTSLLIGPLRAARIGPVKKCKRYPPWPNITGPHWSPDEWQWGATAELYGMPVLGPHCFDVSTVPFLCVHGSLRHRCNNRSNKNESHVYWPLNLPEVIMYWPIAGLPALGQ